MQVQKDQHGSTSLLKNNNKDNREYTIFLCSICNLACSEKEELKEHMINVGKNEIEIKKN